MTLLSIYFLLSLLSTILAAVTQDVDVTYQYLEGRLQIEKETGHDKWEGAMLLLIYEKLL